MIIGLTGHKGSGKTLAADVISREIPEFKSFAFADPLREVCSIVFGLSTAEMSDRSLKEQPLERYPNESPRQIMQKVGTECIRAHYPDAWIEALKHRVKPFPNAVVSDVRFANEAESIRQMGGFIVRIARPDNEPKTDREKDLHPSETVQDAIAADKTVINDGSPVLFAARVLSAVLELKEGK